MKTAPIPHGFNLVAALAATATVCRTVCEGAVTVWHCWGEASAQQPPVVLLHGGSGSWTHWVRNIAALVDFGHHVLVPDLPGFGDSDVPAQGRDVDAMAVPLEAGLAQLVGDVACNVVGFSFGAASGVLWAAQTPTRFAGLVILGAPGFGISHADSGLQAWRGLPDLAAQREVHRHNLAVLMLHAPTAVDAQALDLHAANVARDRLPFRRLLRKPLLLRVLPQVQCPVHVLFGWEDALYRGRQALLESTVRAGTPTLHSFQFIADAGHWAQYEQADAFNTVLQQALQGCL
jgi:2-hydroxy-6-oxonona-2,4-dienedioate hydrolase